MKAATRATTEAKAPGHERDQQEDHGPAMEWTDLVRIGFVGLAILALWIRVWEPFPRVSVSVVQRVSDRGTQNGSDRGNQ